MAVAVDNQHDRMWPRRGLGTIVDFAVRSHSRAVLVLVVAALLNLIPGFFTIPPLDRDEARFAQASKQMIESGDFVDIRFQETSRYKKPVGIYWLQAAVVAAAQHLGLPDALSTVWLYRIPSLVGAVGAVVLTYWAALAFVSRRAAVLAALMLATCFLLAVEGRLAKTDAFLLMTAVACMGAMARAYLPEQRAKLSGWTVPTVFWTALAASVLLKGPVVLALVVLTAGTLVVIDRSARWVLSLRPLSGMCWFALLVLPWFVAITLRSGEGFYAESVGQDLLSKLFSGQESHGAPPGYYFLLFWGTFWPGATLAGCATAAVWGARREPGAKFLLAWLLPAWIVFEIVVTKLPHYVLPLYPAVAILIAGVVDTRMPLTRSWLERGTIWWFIVPSGLGLLALAGLFVIGRQFGLLAWPLIAAAVIMGFWAWRLYEPDKAEDALLRAMVASLLISAAILGAVAPALSALYPSAALARIVRDSGCSTPSVAAAGFHEPSLVFLTGTGTRLTDAASAADFLQGGACRFALIEASQQRAFALRAEAIGLHYSSGPRVDGFNLGSGRNMSISVYRSVPPP